ncbi:hypothetical protein N1028_14260 [Herbiconiux sp. CPCC 203407]|uniref:Uncharacterized protein n=1 Tax=Herbiconiux oxytropis TaxID=2970915 RepID=A0AA41XJ57_9MICO|nr:hypothetical protein [Herbiconiux oxytropis]MCS5722790.1 hypothetical protein [Herbiconiux oxytropis]MCS5727060.1 hypothetical protein [Herbiconiux oxytropis]
MRAASAVRGAGGAVVSAGAVVAARVIGVPAGGGAAAQEERVTAADARWVADAAQVVRVAAVRATRVRAATMAGAAG